MSDKGFIGERGFSTFISPFAEIIEKRGRNLFYKHKQPSYAAVVKEFYSNMMDMKEDAVYVKGVWIPMGHERLTRFCKLGIPKMGLNTRS